MMTCEGGDLHSISTFEVNFFFYVYKVHNDLVLIGLQLQPYLLCIYYQDLTNSSSFSFF